METSFTGFEQSLIPRGIYQHYKGNRYKVLGTARHSETEEPLVIYQMLYGDYSFWARPLTLFCGTVEVDGKPVPRFRFIADNQND